MNWQSLTESAWTQAQTDKHTAMRREWLAALVLGRKSRLVATNISQDTATKLRGAWAIYCTLRHYNAARARELRNRYGYRRFLDMGALWMRYEFSPEAAIDHLESELSNAAMTMQIISTHDPRPEWWHHSVGAYKTIFKLTTDLDVDAEISAWAKQGVELMQRKGINVQ